MLHLGIPQMILLLECSQSAIFKKFIFFSTSKKFVYPLNFAIRQLGLTLIYSGLAIRLKMTTLWEKEIIISIPFAKY
jgi:hypothetical protein